MARPPQTLPSAARPLPLPLRERLHLHLRRRRGGPAGGRVGFGPQDRRGDREAAGRWGAAVQGGYGEGRTEGLRELATELRGLRRGWREREGMDA